MAQIKSLKYEDKDVLWRFNVGGRVSGLKIAAILEEYRGKNDEHVFNIYVENDKREVMLWQSIINMRDLVITYNVEDVK